MPPSKRKNSGKNGERAPQVKAARARQELLMLLMLLMLLPMLWIPITTRRWEVGQWTASNLEIRPCSFADMTFGSCQFDYAGAVAGAAAEAPGQTEAGAPGEPEIHDEQRVDARGTR